MEKKIGIIGHIDHGETTLSATMLDLALIQTKEAKQLNEIIEEERGITITKNHSYEYLIKSGKESRRERRAKERKNNRK